MFSELITVRTIQKAPVLCGMVIVISKAMGVKKLLSAAFKGEDNPLHHAETHKTA